METIIVSTDFSPAANNALDYAMELCNFFNGRIVVVNAYFSNLPIVTIH